MFCSLNTIYDITSCLNNQFSHTYIPDIPMVCKDIIVTQWKSEVNADFPIGNRCSSHDNTKLEFPTFGNFQAFTN